MQHVGKDKWDKINHDDWLLLHEVKSDSSRFTDVSALSMPKRDNCFDIKNLADEIWEEGQLTLDAVILDDNDVLSDNISFYTKQNQPIHPTIPCFILKHDDFFNLFDLQRQTHGKMECQFVKDERSGK